MRDWLQKLVATLRGAKVLAPAGSVANGSEIKGYSIQGSTGETVFDDRPLRFRNLTLAEPDVQAVEDPGVAPGFKIRISKLKRGRVDAGSLVSNKYSRRGYQIPQLVRERDLYTFIAYDEGQLVGTVGVRLDSRRGLGADELYAGEIGALRRQGFRLCEFTRLAVDKRAASKPVLAGLFHTAYLYASIIRGCTHAVIEVNPRHVIFYKRALDFEVAGPERMNTRVNAPAVLLNVSFEAIANGLAQFAGQSDDPSNRSLYPYGFPPSEEMGVLRRLRDLSKSTSAPSSNGS